MKTTEVYADEIYNKWGLILTSEYKGAFEKVSFKCINNHDNTGTGTNILQRGYKCKECTTGYKVVSKITWTKELKLDVMTSLNTKTTLEVAKMYNTTVAAINNMLADAEYSNPASRLTPIKLIETLISQNRELVELKGDLATIECSKHHIHTQEISNIISHNTGCPSCFSLGISKLEKEVISYIESIYEGWIVTKDRTILEGRELDIILPDIGLAIEFNGTYWYREDKVGTRYHLKKTNEVEVFGYQLLHIKDYDWVSKQDIVKSIIKSKIGITDRIYARKCEIRHIPFPRDFLNYNHIQGAGQPTNNNKGLFYKGELVAVATFAKPRFSDEADLELIRYCSKLNTTVVGGISKLLPRGSSILSYANRDYSTGKGYLATGFKLLRVTEPGLEYYYKYTKVSRYKAQGMSTEELSKYHKYYNSGNLVFIRAARS